MTGTPIEKLSPFPIVDLRNISVPKDGFFVQVTEFCKRKFIEERKCHAFYEEIAKTGSSQKLRQCPYGFACLPFEMNGAPYALTGLIPHPRVGGEAEQRRSKDNPDARVAVEQIQKATVVLSEAERQRIEALGSHAKNYPQAIHEIRKLNRSIKHEAERLLSDNDLHFQLRNSLTTIQKSSELMSYQFEILDLLANETLAGLVLNTDSEIYRMVDKCVRIYEPIAMIRNIKLNLEGDITGSPSIWSRVCDKTFPIIPTVLIENAIKHSLPETVVIIRVKRLGGSDAQLSVRSIGPRMTAVPVFFKKGVTGGTASAGQGFGLYLAQLVAKQHGTSIEFARIPGNGCDHFIFQMKLACSVRKGNPMLR
jgi:signal transduction histidine kinase